ncbi:hypothetical protein DMH04_55615 [Kibdelosporangium aridum]|uniref:Uncharacterized protein n=2 Tax=Kibdelosporangium aridum TaxID=2030 RepID=A0A428XWA1_KIBAR|nr:hypothetical protein DMH04_55615 [Kibdelosporangium aridum]
MERSSSPSPLSPAPAGPITAVLHHNGVESDFADGPVVTDDPRVITRAGSPPIVLRPVDHPVLEQAATFNCAHCGESLFGGLARREVRIQRQQAAERARRRRRYWTGAVLTVIWLGYGLLTIGRTGAVATFFAEPWLIVVGLGWLSMVVLGLALPEVDIPPETVIMSNFIGGVSESGRHHLTLRGV